MIYRRKMVWTAN